MPCILYNRREKENKMREAIRKRNVAIRQKIRNERNVKRECVNKYKSAKIFCMEKKLTKEGIKKSNKN